MIQLRNIVNGFVLLERHGRVFIADPWTTNGIFDGGWAPYPPIKDPKTILSRCDYLYISHIHEDHFDPAAIAQIPRTCRVIILDMFPNQVIQQRLAGLGFSDITMVKPLAPTQIGPDLTVELIPPLNSFAQEMELYRRGLKTVAIDSGIAITWGGG